MQYTEQDLKQQLKPVSENGFVACFQKLWRGWLSAWYGFADKHEKFANLIYMVFFFFVFSMGVTIYQYIIMTFLPLAFTSLGTEPWGWPSIPVAAAGGREYIILGDTSGLGYFVAFEIATFTAQCINFPLQRNITYRSHGNPWFQAMWYFIGWILVSVFTSAVWGICNCFLLNWGVPDAVNGLLKTFLTGGVSMVIYFFIFLIIFPNNDRVAKKAKKRYEKLIAANASPEKVEKARAKYQKAQDAADRANAEKAYRQATTQASALALKYFSAVKQAAEAKEEERAALEKHAEEIFAAACEAIEKKTEKKREYDEVMERLGLAAA